VFYGRPPQLFWKFLSYLPKISRILITELCNQQSLSMNFVLNEFSGIFYGKFSLIRCVCVKGRAREKERERTGFIWLRI
jgi:hypothetical protein